MPPLALSKTLDPADFAELAEELAIVDRSFTYERAQHEMRRWEYAMALRAQRVWWAQQTGGWWNGRRVADVGGAGSPFYRMIGIENAFIIDPDGGESLEQFLQGRHARVFPQVYCLSVLEHVDDLDRFLYHLSCLVAPGGLLFLTADYCDGDSTDPFEFPPDTYHFHWMRQRIFNPLQWWAQRGSVLARLQHDHFTLLGEIDRAYHGPQVYDYTFASLALIKRA